MLDPARELIVLDEQTPEREPPHETRMRKLTRGHKKKPKVDHRVARAVNLFFLGGRALSIPAPHLIKSIFGAKNTFFDVGENSGTERDVLRENNGVGRAALLRALFPQWLLSRGLWEESGPLPHAVRAPGVPAVVAKECWFFINGICTDKDLAICNAKLLSKLFRRPIHVLYNATNGFFSDLWECIQGKGFDLETEAIGRNLTPLVDALISAEFERVILVSHSQGTILTAVLLKVLEEIIQRNERELLGEPPAHVPHKRLSKERLRARHWVEDRLPKHEAREMFAHLKREHIAKLELYCFANCATSMEPFVSVAEKTCPPSHAPWIESYGNEKDLVAQLGMLCPPHGIGATRILGDRYERDGAWGHLLNAHYLLPLERERSGQAKTFLTPTHDNLRPTPRLYEYLDGKQPPSYWGCGTPSGPGRKRAG